jgi:hypothetical protein
LFERDFVKRRGAFTALVNACRKQVAEQARRQVRLVLYRSRPQVEVNDIAIKLSSKQHLFLLCLAQRAAAGQPRFSKYAEALHHLRSVGETLYAQRNTHDFSDWRFDVRLAADAGDEAFRKLRDEIIHKLEAKGAATAALIPLLPKCGRCSLDLSPAAISFKD